jgi:hypothetical protein
LQFYFIAQVWPTHLAQLPNLRQRYFLIVRRSGGDTCAKTDEIDFDPDTLYLESKSIPTEILL